MGLSLGRLGRGRARPGGVEVGDALGELEGLDLRTGDADDVGDHVAPADQLAVADVAQGPEGPAELAKLL